MRQTLSALAFLLTIQWCTAQLHTVGAAESFWDSDPGCGNGTAFIVASNDTVALEGEISTAGLSPGIHVLHVRMQRDDGLWGETVARKVFVGIGTDFQAAEVFFDNDPGPGAGTAVNISSDGRILETEFPVPTISRGFHKLNLRCNSGGTWSGANARLLRVGSAWIDGAEVFFDNDPGEGNGTAVDVGSGPDVVALDSSVAITATASGFRTVNLRFRGGDVWSFPKSQTMRIGPWVDGGTNRITGGEMFFDTDPGEGNGCAFVAEDGSFDELEETMYRYALDSSLTLGEHVVYARIRDGGGRWHNVVRETLQIVEAHVVSTAVLDTAGHHVLVAWTGYPTATAYYVGYDSLLTGTFSQFVTVAAPDTFALLPVDPLKRYYRVTAVQADGQPCEPARLMHGQETEERSLTKSR